MKVLLSIKPEYATPIFDGSKKFEFRKAIFKNENVKTVVVYASSSMQRVIGEFDIKRVLCKTPEDLWEVTSSASGISKDFFFDYFAGRDVAYAIEVKNARLYNKPKCLRCSYNVCPPQSFCYLTTNAHKQTQPKL